MDIKIFKINKLANLFFFLSILGSVCGLVACSGSNNLTLTPTKEDDSVFRSPINSVSASSESSPIATPASFPSPQVTYEIELEPISTLAGEVSLGDKTLYYIIMPVYGPLALTGLAADNQQIWVVNNQTDSMFSVDPKSGEILKTYPFPETLGEAPNITGLTWDGENFWLAEINTKTLFQYDPDFQVQLTSFTVDTHPGDIAWDGKTLWVVSRETSELQNWSTDGKLLKAHRVPGRWITGLTWGADRLWYSDTTEKVVRYWDPSSSTAKVVITDALAERSFGGLGWLDDSLLLLDDLGGRLLSFDVNEFNFVK